MIGGCTRQFVGRLGALGVPVMAKPRPVGAHAWTYWWDDVHESRPLFAAALGG